MSAGAAAAIADAPADLGIPVCRAADVPFGEGRAVTIEGRRIAIFNTATGWYALDHACSHRGGPLADGLVADSCVTCPLHERRFDLASGECVGDGEPVATYRVSVHGPDIYVQPARRAA